MSSLKNLIHAAVLATWALMGVIFTFKTLFTCAAFMPALVGVASYWLWFAALAGITTAMVSKVTRPVGALLIHGLLFLTLLMIPQVFPLNLLRLGLDLLLRG
jgi:hypothetical protein